MAIELHGLRDKIFKPNDCSYRTLKVKYDSR